MSKQIIEVEVDLPEGWKAVAFRAANKGEHYTCSDDGSASRVCVSGGVSSRCYIILEPDTSSIDYRVSVYRAYLEGKAIEIKEVGPQEDWMEERFLDVWDWEVIDYRVAEASG